MISIAAPDFRSARSAESWVLCVVTITTSTLGVTEAELSFIEATLRPDCILPGISTVCAPAALLYLTECKYKRWGGNRARRMGQDTAVARSIVAWRASLQAKLVLDARRRPELWEPWYAAQSQMRFVG